MDRLRCQVRGKKQDQSWDSDVPQLTKIGKKKQSLLFRILSWLRIIVDNNLKEMPGPAF